MITKAMMSVAAGSALLLGAGSALAQEGGRRLTTQLTGAAEVPGPGDPEGSGTAEIRVNPGQGRICFTLTVSGIAPATAAHIHPGAAGQARPPIVNLAPPTSGTSSGCVDVDRAVAQTIIRNPSNFYVNVHNAEFKAGAVRGQLSR